MSDGRRAGKWRKGKGNIRKGMKGRERQGEDRKGREGEERRMVKGDKDREVVDGGNSAGQENTPKTQV